jgi:hypothetical protein
MAQFVNNESERMWKEAFTASSELIFMHLPGEKP